MIMFVYSLARGVLFAYIKNDLLFRLPSLEPRLVRRGKNDLYIVTWFEATLCPSPM